ncbi:hypothetical protein GZL_04334 [Streptomyces sp. 769]|nr:hypothetical protein GZL_04334 [Streptomyces sp. 769]
MYLWDGVNMQNPLSVSRAIGIIGYPPKDRRPRRVGDDHCRVR